MPSAIVLMTLNFGVWRLNGPTQKVQGEARRSPMSGDWPEPHGIGSAQPVTSDFPVSGEEADVSFAEPAERCSWMCP